MGGGLGARWKRRSSLALQILVFALFQVGCLQLVYLELRNSVCGHGPFPSGDVPEGLLNAGKLVRHPANPFLIGRSERTKSRKSR